MMQPEKPTDESTLEEVAGEPRAPEETPDALARPSARRPHRVRVLLLAGALLLLITLCILHLFPFVFLPCETDNGRPFVKLPIEGLSLSPNKFLVVRVTNYSPHTLWYVGLHHQHPSFTVEYRVKGDSIPLQLGNSPMTEEKIPLRSGERMLFAVPLVDWERYTKTRPEAVRVDMAVYRTRSVPWDEFDWFWSAPKDLQ